MAFGFESHPAFTGSQPQASGIPLESHPWNFGGHPQARTSIKASVPRGGYDCEFIEEPPEKFICSICAEVLRDPHLTKCCGQHFCGSCIEDWIKQYKTKVCPYCHERNFIHMLNKALKREINELKVYCINQEKGCWWKDELDNLETHLKDCGYVEVECSNKCKHRLMRKRLGKHLRSECLLREYTCIHCHHVDTYHAITGDCPPSKKHCPAHPSHYDSCPELKLRCSKCGERNIKRKDMTDHQSQCPKEPVDCRFKEAGCEVKPLRSELDDHMTQNTQQHLMLMIGAFRELKEENQKLKEEYKERLDRLEKQVRRKSQKARSYSIPQVCPPVQQSPPSLAQRSQAPQTCIFEI